MTHPWIPNSDPKILKDMLEAIGVSSVEELYRDLPREVFLTSGEWDRLPIGEGRPLSEAEVEERFRSLMSKNARLRAPPFMGGGVWPRYVPAAVRYIIERAEFLTSYTPYQAEVSQGLMQALYEYQSLIAELVELEVVNSSLYDWSSAIGEAFLMSMRVTKRRRILVPETMNPLHYRVAETYLQGAGGVLESYRVDPETGLADLDDLGRKLARGDAAAVYLEYPGYLGVVEEQAREIGEEAHKAGALYIMGFEPISLALLEPPGRLGADIAVGEGQPLGLGLNYGGPYLGIMAVRWDRKLVMQMPGRIIGETVDVEGRRAFVMVLQAREQHIRRAKATSNITTNEALMALAAAAYLSLLGPDGLREVAEASWLNAHYLARRLSEIPGVESPLLKGEFIMDFTVRLPKDARKVRRKLAREGFQAGIPLEGHTDWLGKGDLLLTATEVHTREHLDALVDTLSHALSEAG